VDVVRHYQVRIVVDFDYEMADGDELASVDS